MRVDLVNTNVAQSRHHSPSRLPRRNARLHGFQRRPITQDHSYIREGPPVCPLSADRRSNTAPYAAYTTPPYRVCIYHGQVPVER